MFEHFISATLNVLLSNHLIYLFRSSLDSPKWAGIYHMNSVEGSNQSLDEVLGAYPPEDTV